MIVAVIADDLSGAAELAGAAADLGFSAEVQTRFDPTSHAQILAIDTDTRLLPPDVAAQRVTAITAQLLRSEPIWLYKKTDSVLRGNVTAEIAAIFKTTGLTRIILIPANPSKGRIIRRGIYYVAGVPLAQTGFSKDPHHPRTSSNVTELLAASPDVPINCVQGRQSDFEEGITITDIETADDVINHAAGLPRSTLPAGGVEFFQALLKIRLTLPPASTEAPLPSTPALFVCGSPQAWKDGRQAQCDRHQIPVSLLPATSAHSELQIWTKAILKSIRDRGVAMAAIGDQYATDVISNSPVVPLTHFAQAIAQVVLDGSISTLAMEGGATAAGVLNALNWTRFRSSPAPSLPGVASLYSTENSALTLLIKPGSYPWPDQLWLQLEAGPNRH